MGEAAGMDPNSVYVGDKAHRKQGLLTVRHPTTDGFLSDWNDIEKLWHHTFHDELDIATKEHSILLTEPQVNPKALRERMAAMIFEDFDFSTMYIKAKEVLSLYSSGCITGVALDIGDGISCSVPACDGYAIRHAVKRSGIYGRDLTDCLEKSLVDRGYSFPSVADRDIIRNIKENLCYVASDYKKEMDKFSTEASSLEKKFELPDGKVISIGSEQIRCTETLFQPSMIGMDFYPGLHETLNDSILKCVGDLRKDLYGNIVLCGGTTRTPGLTERMQSEITKLAPLIKNVKVKTPPDIKNSAWVGGSILASLPTFQQMCITREEYDEIGPTIVNKKCC